ncbi:hypothetical protein DPMN_141991 [Dreissena polymorpha]|uniref:Uncharacterized protein n=1 Tax=Dreissena polymorpha TaxID=45954 RepID=A0A9D4JIS7_DREPO|nr:hypothetical protein DPMN_141991 [Dreissena polymorpha]
MQNQPPPNLPSTFESDGGATLEQRWKNDDAKVCKISLHPTFPQRWNLTVVQR